MTELEIILIVVCIALLIHAVFARIELSVKDDLIASLLAAVEMLKERRP